MNDFHVALQDLLAHPQRVVQLLEGYMPPVYVVMAALLLVAHFDRRFSVMSVVIAVPYAIFTPILFFGFAFNPAPKSFLFVVSILFLYGCTFFVVLSELLLRGFAKTLTRKRGEKWTKEMDYLYLSLGSVGILGALSRIEFLTGRFERSDIIAPLLLMTAIVIRFVKTRAEIGEWNKVK